MGYLINDVLAMEVLPFYVLTPIFLHIWLQQARYSRKTRHNPSFSRTSLIRCYSVTTMDVSMLYFGFLWFLAGQSGCRCNNMYFCNNVVVGRNWGSQDYGIKKPTGCESRYPYTYTDLVINLSIINQIHNSSMSLL